MRSALAISILGSVLGGVALAAYESYNLNRAMNVAEAIARSVAEGFGGESTRTAATVDISLCFGLIPLGRVENPYLAIALGDFILGTVFTGFAILLVYTLRGVCRRNRNQHV